MGRIINFIMGRRDLFLYLLLMTLSLAMSVQSHSYHRSKFFNSSNWVSGQIYSLSLIHI